jgi:putative spermidine/putrescine transport system permease protein
MITDWTYATLLQKLTFYGLRIFGVAACLYLILPIIIYLPLSFSERALLKYPIDQFSLRWYRALVENPEWANALLNSVYIAAVATVLASLLGVVAAIGLWWGSFPGRKALVAVIMMPMVVPSVVAAVSIYFAFGQVGLNSTYTGLILAHTALAAPLVVITVMATLTRFDANLLRAAASLGAGPITTFRRVTLPLILPGVLTGAIFAFSVSFDDVVTSLFVAGPSQRTLPVKIYLATSDIADLTITAAATFMLVVAVAMMVVINLLRRGDRLRTSADSKKNLLYGQAAQGS